MPQSRTFDIAVLPGDGIGVDVIAAARAVLDAAQRRAGGFALSYRPLDAGAAYFKETGEDISKAAFEACGNADAILLGAMGLPSVRYADGTEVAPHLRMRDVFQLYAGVRPVKAFPNTPRRLLDERAANIDLIVLRESTEGLFYSHGRGEVIGDSEARETLRITRATSEKLFDVAFKLARRRKERAIAVTGAAGHSGQVTCVDKANVFRSMAFFRKIFDERAARNPDIKAGHNYVDAQALDLIRRPWDFDVLVMENMFGDILSDLGGGLVGGMGMAPCAELGDNHGLFQPAHGSAPDIAGQGKANPTAAVLSAAMMLDWLGGRHGVESMVRAAGLIEAAVDTGFASGRLRPYEFGGTDSTQTMTRTMIELLG